MSSFILPIRNFLEKLSAESKWNEFLKFYSRYQFVDPMCHFHTFLMAFPLHFE